MRTPNTFLELVRHEFKFKGSWSKQNRTGITKWWKVAYFSLLLIAGLGTATYFAYNNTLRFERLWFVTLGLPYSLFFVGFAMMKREYENETYGWWLTLPYPRMWLIGAKWAAAWLQLLCGAALLYLVGVLYVSSVALALSHYTFADVGSFMLSGFNWLLILVCSGPLILSFGLLTASTQITAMRPIAPIFWIVFMGGGGLIVSGISSLLAKNELFLEFSGAKPPTWFPFSWEVIAAIAASWLLAYLIVRLIAYTLENKLSV